MEVLVREPDDKTTRRFKSLVSNIQRENIGAVELAETLHTLLEEEAVPTQRELARQIGKREQWVSEMLRILDMPAKLLEQLRGPASAIGYDMAQKIGRVEDPQLQQELITAALTGETNREIRHRIARSKPAPARLMGQGRASVLQFTEKVGNCIATVKCRHEPQARDEMLTALRQLERQIRNDDTLR
jgi:ParB-like chromosome segregation protein Spo0J